MEFLRAHLPELIARDEALLAEVGQEYAPGEIALPATRRRRSASRLSH
ncbi:transcriptional regulator LysR family [Caballeronia insecticola]|uniref:Transcriptional regulator LysR family n=1 Tax=Caballeronia insecticola TaxID=758793 RepID=R4WL00_9BURK|nr:transcriptional regulator LysR family [Caballeronia insecticola]